MSRPKKNPHANVRVLSSRSRWRASGLQLVALQARREVLQRADAARFGFAAPRLQVLQRGRGVVAARFEHRREAGAMFDQGADARTLRDPFLHLLARVGLEPAAIVADALAHRARE